MESLLIYLVLLLILLGPSVVLKLKTAMRAQLIRRVERKRNSRIITLIHRSEPGFLGLTAFAHISMEDSEEIIDSIRLTPRSMPIDLIVHTPGGIVLAAEQIVRALKQHKGAIRIFVPIYAMSGGTLLALASTEINMSTYAMLGPVDPQLSTGLFSAAYPAASIVKALKEPNPNRNDQTIILGDIAEKALVQLKETVGYLLKDKLPKEQAEELAVTLTQGTWTHDYPLTIDRVRALGIQVNEGIPDEIEEIFKSFRPYKVSKTTQYTKEPRIPEIKI